MCDNGYSWNNVSSLAEEVKVGTHTMHIYCTADSNQFNVTSQGKNLFL